ncbi:MAG: hypothetical protein A3G87_01470 [Omnitrophica bacterium RIFCSPLOWO2_12_FULL_50_11]|nr:MAG: hypothetical protein A3G87_01470 [Omnitrophica bacterium RIFCSPLOWO2_12_FULL_50_11]
MSSEERGKELEVELQRILGILKTRVQPQKVILFGSLVSGRLRPDSDIDLLIVQDSKEPIFDRVKKIEAVLDRRYAADLIVLTPTEVQSLLDSDNRYVKKIFSGGRVLYERTA